MSAQTDRIDVLNAMVMCDKRVISYRTFSSEQAISIAEAQAYLLEYWNSRTEKVEATWAVTSECDSIQRIALVKGVQPTVENGVRGVSVWAVAARTDGDSGCVDMWIRADRSREFKIAKEKPLENNELRDNPWNPIMSEIAGWHLGGAAAKERARMEKLSKERAAAIQQRRDGGIAAKVKAEAAAREADRRRRVSGVKNSSIQFSKSVSKKSDESTSRPKTSEGEQRKSTAFRSLGSSLNRNQKPSTAPSKRKASGEKKTRRIIEESDDEAKSSEDDDEDDFETKREREAMEAEAREAEVAEKERARLIRHEEEEKEKKLFKVDRKSGGKSATVGNAAENGAGGSQRKKRSRDDTESDETTLKSRSRKRSFGASDIDDTTRLRKKYKAVEVDVTEVVNGYITTKRVTKYVDEFGNEKPEEHGENNSGKEKDKGGDCAMQTEMEKSSTANKKKAIQNKNQIADSTEPKKETVKRAVGKSKGKNKSIMSYFGKKS